MSMRLFAFIVVVAACIIQAAPISTNPVDFAVFETNNVQVKRTPIDSLFSGTSSSPRALIVKDTGISHKFKEWDIDTFLVWLNDTLGIDSVDYADTAGYAAIAQQSLSLKLGFGENIVPLVWYQDSVLRDKYFYGAVPDTVSARLIHGINSYSTSSSDGDWGPKLTFYTYPSTVYNSSYFGVTTLGNGAAGTRAAIELRNFNTISFGRERALLSWRKRDATSSSHNDFELLTYSTAAATAWIRHMFINGETGQITLNQSWGDPNRTTKYPVVVANGGIKPTRAIIDTTPLTAVPVYAMVKDSLGDTIKSRRIDSLTVKRAATAAVSDSTAKNAPHGVTSGFYGVSGGFNLWTTGSLRETSAGYLGLGANSVSGIRLYIDNSPTNSAEPFCYAGIVYPTVTADGAYGATGLQQSVYTNLNGHTSTGSSRALHGGSYHNSVGNITNVYGLDFSYGTTATSNASNVTGRAAGINITPYFGGTGTYAVATDIYIAAPAATGATVANEWCLFSLHNAMSRLEGGLQLDNAASRLWLGEAQQGSIYHDGSNMLYVNTVGGHWFSGTPVVVGSSSVNTKADSNSITSRKWMDTPEGGRAIKIVNRTGAASVKGYMVHPSPSYDTSCTLSVVDVPDPIGVVYDSGVANGSEMWVVTNGIADVYFIGSATRGHIARGFVTGDAGYVAGQAMSEAVPAAPFATDKHFYEIGHVIQSRTGAGLARCVLHQN